MAETQTEVEVEVAEPAPEPTPPVEVDADQYEELRSAMEERRVAETKQQWAADAAKAAKKALEVAQGREERAVEAIFDPQKRLFDESGEATAAAKDLSVEDVEGTALRSLDIPAQVIANLAALDPPVVTVGALAKLQKGDPQWDKKVPGIGEAARQKIEDAVAALWMRVEDGKDEDHDTGTDDDEG